jgi:hypothetical protein
MNPLASEIRRRPTRPNFLDAEPLMTVVLGTRQEPADVTLPDTRRKKGPNYWAVKNNRNREVTARGQNLQACCHRFLMSSEECDSAVTRQIAETFGSGSDRDEPGLRSCK